MTCTATRHGTASAYRNVGCRCETARRAQLRYHKRWQYDRTQRRPRRIPAIGAQRRLRALAAIGWDEVTLARLLGLQRLNCRRPYVTAKRHRQISDLYNQLADHPGPSSVSRAMAAYRGWPPPLAWDDDLLDDPDVVVKDGYVRNFRSEEFFHTFNGLPSSSAGSPVSAIVESPDVDPIAVERYLAGDRTIRLNKAEKQSGFDVLRSKGLPVSRVGEHLGLSGSTARLYEERRLSTDTVSTPEIVHTSGDDADVTDVTGQVAS